MANTSVDDLKGLLKKLKDSNFNEINVFDAVGMTSQETKHSAFLAWLLSPKNPHGFGIVPLQYFVNSLFRYKTKTPPNIQPPNTVPFSNAQIVMRNYAISNEKKLCNIITDCNLDKIKVETEYPTDIPNGNKGRRRIDVLIDIPIAGNETVIVIENKVFAQLSKDQLKDYYEYICDRNQIYKNYTNKIFVFLNRDGDIPVNSKGQYDGNWCVYDYVHIRGIVDNVKNANLANKYLKHIMEDYCDMVNKVILKTDDKWEIVSNYASNIVELYECVINKQANLDYCRNWLKDNVDGYIEDNISDSSFTFHTQAIDDCFKRHNEQYGYLKCTWFCGSNGGVDGVIKTDKNSGVKALINSAVSTYNSNAKSNGQLALKKTYNVIPDNETWLKPLSAIQDDLDKKLEAFKCAIEEYDKLIKTI